MQLPGCVPLRPGTRCTRRRLVAVDHGPGDSQSTSLERARQEPFGSAESCAIIIGCNRCSRRHSIRPNKVTSLASRSSWPRATNSLSRSIPSRRLCGCRPRTVAMSSRSSSRATRDPIGVPAAASSKVIASRPRVSSEPRIQSCRPEMRRGSSVTEAENRPAPTPDSGVRALRDRRSSPYVLRYRLGQPRW